MANKLGKDYKEGYKRIEEFYAGILDIISAKKWFEVIEWITLLSIIYIIAEKSLILRIIFWISYALLTNYIALEVWRSKIFARCFTNKVLEVIVKSIVFGILSGVIYYLVIIFTIAIAKVNINDLKNGV